MSGAVGPADVAGVLSSRTPRLGGGHLVCVDGPSGSGKTTLAAALESTLGWRVVHLDDLYEGWAGLSRGLEDRILEGILAPLTRGEPGAYRRFDWHRDAFAEEHTVTPPADGEALVLEGVGAGASPWADLISALVWVEADRDVRLRRGLDRDGEAFAPHWEAWAAEEQRHFARHRTRERADLVLRT